MNFLVKTFFAISILINLQSAFGGICVNTTSNYKMFGSVLRSDILKNPFLMAFQDEHFTKYKIFYADNDEKLLNQLQSIIHEDCSVILGLFTSHDCLVSGQALKKNKIIILSSSCSDDHISDFSPYIYTASPKLSDYSKVVAEYINNTPTKNILVFYQPSDVYSDSGFSFFKKHVKKPVEEIRVSSTGDFDLKSMDALLSGESVIIFFTYPLPSAQILVRLDAKRFITSAVSIIGASSWIFDVSVFKPIKSILLKSKNVLTPSLIDHEKVNFSKFASKFARLYKREPDIVEILTYDTARLSVQCYRETLKNGGEYSNERFLRCISSNKHIWVSGYSRFTQESPFAVRKVYLIKFLARI